MMEINLKHPVLFLDFFSFLPVKVSPSSQKRRVEAPPLQGGERILLFPQTKIKKEEVVGKDEVPKFIEKKIKSA